MGWSWFFLFLLSSVGKSTASCALNDPLQCYLYNKVITVPDTCIDVSGSQLCTSNVQITQLTLTSVPSTYQISKPYDLLVSANNAGAKITGHYKYGKFIKGDIVGSVQVSVSLDVLMHTTSSWPGYILPSFIDFASCTFTQMAINIDFGNSLLDAFSRTIDKQIETQIKKEICETMPLQLAAKTSEAFAQTLDPSLERLISTGPSAPLKYDNSMYINWSTSFVGKLHRLLNWFRGSLLFRCIEKTHPAIVTPVLPSYIDSLVNRITEGTGSIVVPLNVTLPFSFGIANSTLSVLSLTVSGLDTIEQLSLLEPVSTSNVSLASSFAMKSLGVSLSLLYKADMQGYGTYTERLDVKGVVNNVLIRTQMVAAVNKRVVDELYLDQLMSPSGLSCLLTAIDALNVTSLVVDMNLTQLIINEIQGSSGSLENNIVSLVNNSIALGLNGFSKVVTGAIAGLAQGPVRSTINKALAKMLASIPSMPCPAHDSGRKEEIVAWPQSPILAQVDSLLNDQIGSDGLNKVLHCITNGTGRISIPLHQDKLQLQVENVDSFYEFGVLVPADATAPYDLLSRLGTGHCESSTCSPIALSLSSATPAQERRVLTSQGLEVSVPDHVRLAISNLHVNLQLLLQLSKTALLSLQVGQLGTKGCLATTMRSLQVSVLNVSLTQATLDIGHGVEEDIGHSLTAVLALLSSPKALQSVNNDISKKLDQSQQVCASGGEVPASGEAPATDASSDRALEWGWLTALIVTSSMAVVGGVIFLYRRRAKTGQNLELSLSQKFYSIHSAAAMMTEETQVPADLGLSLMRDTRLSACLRYSMPVLLAINAAIFIYSNAAKDAVVVNATVNHGALSDSFQVFTFSFAGTVQDMFDAKVYFLGTVICGFTGIWPYVKLLCMLYCWTAPPSLLSVQTRYSYLKFVDAYGKYSLVDYFVMILMIVAFYFQMHLGDDLDIVLTTVPRAGFYTFLVSTVLSLVLGHVILATHRHARDIQENEVHESGHSSREFSEASRDSLVQHKFILRESDARTLLGMAAPDQPGGPQDAPTMASPHNIDNCDNVRLRLSRAGMIAVAMLHVATVLFVLYGTYVKTFSFSFQGLTGWLLQSAAEVQYSYDSVGQFMLIASGTPGDWRMLVMQFCYYTFGVGMPLGLCAMLAGVWAMPMSLLAQKRSLIVVEVLNAWSSLDVFCLAIIAAIFQIRRFSAFIVGDSCDGINKFLAKYLDVALDGDDVCFDVVTKLLPQAWTIFVSAVMVFLLACPSLILLDICIEDRKKAVRYRASDSSGCSVAAGFASRSKSSSTISRNSKDSRQEVDFTRPLLEDILLDATEMETPRRDSNPGSPIATSHSSLSSPAASSHGLLSSMGSLQSDRTDHENFVQQPEKPAWTGLAFVIGILWALGLVELSESNTIISRSKIVARLRSGSGNRRSQNCDVSVTEHYIQS